MMRVSSCGLLLAAFALAGSSVRADDAARPALAPPTLREAGPQVSPTFFNTIIVPGVDARLRGDSAAAVDFATFRTNPLANPWTRDARAVERVGSRAMNATQDAVKRYLIDRLGLDQWSLPLGGGRGGGGLASLRTDSGGTRLRFGVAHLAPRAELLIPSGNTGRVTLGLDGRGRVAVGFETPSARVRVGGSYDPGAHDANVVFVARF